MFNLFGLLPAPYIYGAIADIGPVVGGNKPQAMRITFCIPLLAGGIVVFHAVLIYLRIRKE